MDVSYQLLISLLPSPGIELTLLGYVNESNQRLYSLCYLSLTTSVREFLGIRNLMSSATIFTSAHIAILLLSMSSFLLFFYQSDMATKMRTLVRKM